MTFLMKQHDLRPYITGQILAPHPTLANQTVPLDLTNATGTSIIVRKRGSTVVKFKKTLTITNATQGEWEYSWDLGDTDETGTFEFEIEIMWGTEPQTVPVAGYETFTINDDIDSP